MDLYTVRVEDRDDFTVQLRLHIHNVDCVGFPLSRSFALMLLGDGPGDKRYRAWMNAQDEQFDHVDHVVSVELREVRQLPRVHGQPPAGMSRDDVDERRLTDPGVLGEALIAITVDAPGMLDHLDPGTSWGSTAFDEAGRGPVYDGAAGQLRQWHRDRRPT